MRAQLGNFPAGMREELSPFVRAGYTRVGGFPPLVLDLNFTSFDQYMNSRLSRVTRKRLRRKLRKADAISPPIAFEVLTACRGVIDEVYPLYLSVANRAPLGSEFSRASISSRPANTCLVGIVILFGDATAR